jgi:hypothetical protein
MWEDKCDNVEKIIRRWSPKEKYPKEEGYRNELIGFIRSEFEKQEKNRIFGEPEKHVIKPESGRSHADIEIDKKIGIELKRNLSGKSEMDRLFGQIQNYQSEYDCVIVVLCGEVKEETAEELDYKLDELNERFMEPFSSKQKITLIRKDEAKIKRKGR